MSNHLRTEARLIIRHLSEIGPRLAGSPQEATVAAFVNARLRHTGMGVSTNPLRLTPRHQRTYALAAAAGLVAALTALVLPIPALILALLGLLLLIVNQIVGPLVHMGKQLLSQTIVGNRAIFCAHSSALGPPPPRWRVVLLAPLDTTMAPPSRWDLVGRVVALFVVVLAALLDLLLPARGWVLLSIPASLLLVIQILALLREPQPAPGDADTGALATLLLSTQHLRDMQRVEVWAIAVGASALDPAGIEEVLRIYPFDPNHTLLISLEHVGSGTLHYALSQSATSHPLLTRATTFLHHHSQLAPLPQSVFRHHLDKQRLPHLTLFSTIPDRPDPDLSLHVAEMVAGIIAQIEQEELPSSATRPVVDGTAPPPPDGLHRSVPPRPDRQSNGPV
ncbi:hypothetical protein [Candidatus Oscillochloris fontis]|uniref:hypothetical protein n=1 Tax=Candidatus Oscillochloris fontis TaxID=2496868 RepID=UPI00101D0628|nr:hypothetical protein [Candidatus Oscillochloris fontis]